MGYMLYVAGILVLVCLQDIVQAAVDSDQATGFNFVGLLACRVGLGVFEAGFGPGIPLYLCEYI